MKSTIPKNMKRSKFLRLTSLIAASPFIGTYASKKKKALNVSPIEYDKKMKKTKALNDLLRYPLMTALFGRRARRFGWGMEIPSGPLAYRSKKEAMELSETEQMLLVAAATGVSGWNFGVPFSPPVAHSHTEFTVRFTGRTAPTAAGIGSPALFFTDDKGCYCTLTRDVKPSGMQELGKEVESLERIISVCKENTKSISEGRLDLPSSPPHVLPPNHWWANKPGSTLFMPVADAAEECLGILALLIRHGAYIIDEDNGKAAGNLEPFVKSGLLDTNKRFPLSEILTIVREGTCLAAGFKGHNMVLMLQALGLGGLYFSGLDDMSIMGARSKDGIKGLGFEVVHDERWVTPNPVGLKGVYEALCPPFYADMHEAVSAFVKRKFGEKGAYKADGIGPWRKANEVKSSVNPYEQEFIDCMGEIAQYIYTKYGKFPGLRSTMVMPGFVQAHHLDTEFYDRYYEEGAYLESHKRHEETWHV